MAMSAAGITAKLEATMGPIMGVEDTDLLKTFTVPMGNSLYTIYLALIITAPPPIPPATETAGGPCLIAGKSESEVKTIIDDDMRSAVNPTDSAAFQEFIDGIAPGIVASYTIPNMSVICPPGGGFGATLVDGPAVETAIEDGIKAEKNIEDDTQLKKFSVPFAASINTILEDDMEVEFEDIGGVGVVT